VRGLTEGKHGFHIHQFGDVRSADGKSAGGHFNPDGHDHGGPDSDKHHAGDLGNITANAEGLAEVNIKAKELKVISILGRSIVVHGGVDDLKSQPSGAAGPRVGVGVIGIAGPPPVKKAATKKAK
jgi:Cu-Zn family superoxide dismutase